MATQKQTFRAFKNALANGNYTLPGLIQLMQNYLGALENATGGGGGSDVSFTQTLTTGTECGTITIDDVTTKIYAPTPAEPTDVEVTQVQTTGTKIATITVDDVPTDIYAPEGGGGTLTQKLPLMSSNTEAEGTASGNAHGGVTTYYKSIDGSGTASDAIELASSGEYLQFTFTNPTALMYMTYHAVGASGTRGADITADYSTDGTTWTKGAMQFNPANTTEEIFKQYINDTVKAIRIYNNQGIGAVKIYKIEAY